MTTVMEKAPDMSILLEFGNDLTSLATHAATELDFAIHDESIGFGACKRLANYLCQMTGGDQSRGHAGAERLFDPSTVVVIDRAIAGCGLWKSEETTNALLSQTKGLADRLRAIAEGGEGSSYKGDCPSLPQMWSFCLSLSKHASGFNPPLDEPQLA